MLTYTLHPASSYTLNSWPISNPAPHTTQFVLFLAPQALAKPCLALGPVDSSKSTFYFTSAGKGKLPEEGERHERDCIDFF